MNVLSFCKNIGNFRKLIDSGVIQANEEDIEGLVFNETAFQAILVDNPETILALNKKFNRITLTRIPVIILLGKSANFEIIHSAINNGATDFSIEPYGDLKQVIQSSIHKLDEYRTIAEEGFNRLRKSLTVAIPHEFNTPITCILGLASMMAKEDLNDVAIVRKFSRKIVESINRLRKLIDNYVYYSYLQLKLSSSSEVTFARSFVVKNPDQIIKMAVHELQYEFNRKIQYKAGSAMINCSETNFYKLITYLLENAMKFSEQGSEVSIEAEVAGSEYKIVVYNEGTGFSSEQLKMIGVFSQFDRESNEQQGLGMGLAIVLSLLNLYGGRIDIVSEKNKFTKIELYVKLADFARG